MDAFNIFLKEEKNIIDILSNKIKRKIEFIEEDYAFLKPIFKDLKFTENIYKIIIEVLNTEKIDLCYKHLVLGDFLFSILSINEIDPANLYGKIRRDSYFNKIMIRAEINNILGLSLNAYMVAHKKLIIGLRINNILIRTKVSNIRNNVWESIVYMELNTNIEVKDNLPIGYSSVPFIDYEINMCTYAIGSFRNIWKMKRKKKEMVEFPINYASIIRASRIKFIISKKLYELNRSLIERQKDSILRDLKCENIEDYFDKLKKITKDWKYSCDLYRGKEIINDTSFEEIISLLVETRNEQLKIFKYFQKILQIKLLERDIFDKNIYIPCFGDNRSRQYYGTSISPTFYKTFRFLYEMSENKNFLGLEESVFYKKIMKYEEEVKEFNLNKKEIYLAIVLFIEIGKNFISTEEDFSIKTEEIVKEGMLNYRNRSSKKFEDDLYINKIYRCLDDLINKNFNMENTLIFKDATSSGLQNFGILLGYREEKLKYLNLDGDDWCDTYRYIIDKYLKNEKKFLLKRKYWKKTIMTIPYNSEWYSCFIEFLNTLRENGVEYTKLDNELKNYIKATHKSFYTKVKEDLKKDLYRNEKNQMIMFEYNEWIEVSKNEYKITYKKHRDKYINPLFMIVKDEKSTERALEANNMHNLDAQLVIYLIEKFEIMTVHDCFGIRLCELHLVMDEINRYYNKKTGCDTYGLHVII